MMIGYQHLINLKSRLGRSVRHIAVDTRGNALAIVGAALIPLMAMIGSGIDMSRAYMTKARLQQACDSGALAGRAAMTGTTFTTTAQAQAEKYFDFNYPAAAFASNTIVRTFTDGGQGQVNGTASSKLPTGVMQLFGITNIDLSVTCRAKLDFVNTDVVLVLDTTGSMNTVLSTGETRLEALQSAVGDLYDTLEPIGQDLHTRNLRLRYGVIPYSITANVGKLLYARNTAYIRNPYDYYACTSRNGSGTCTAATLTTVTKPTSWFTSTWSGCLRARQTSNAITSTTTTIPTAAKDMDIDLLPTSGDTTTQWQPSDPVLDTAWQTQTTAALTKSFTSCPEAARDLTEYYDASGSTTKRTDFLNYIGSLQPSGGTYHDTGMIWGAQMIAPEQGVFNVPLPSEPSGNRNPKSFNNIAVNKHIIFMTDGIMDSTGVSIDRYSMYGTERFTKATKDPGSSWDSSEINDMIARHKNRFSLMCQAAKDVGAEIWVIQFEEGAADTTLQNCASGADHFANVTGKQALIDQFTKIGKAIGALRITQ